VDSATSTSEAAPKAAAWRRWLGIGLRSAHLAAVTLLGAALLGAPVATAPAAIFTAASGAALLVLERLDGRILLGDLAGAVSLAKLAVVAWMALDAARAPLIFWCVLVASALSSHAPRSLRHWRPGR
jgi:hypothetical protein